MLSLANQVGDHPMLLPGLEILHSKPHYFGASGAASNEQRQNRSITFASQAVRAQSCEQGFGLNRRSASFRSERPSVWRLNSTDSGCQFRTEKSCIGCLVCESSHSR